jgi:hypothetical protein
MTSETLLGSPMISAWDNVRLHPRAWIWLFLALASVSCEEVTWQQQHLDFVAFTGEHWAHWRQPPDRAVSQQALQQQQAFDPEEMPRQNSLRFPLGQTH